MLPIDGTPILTAAAMRAAEEHAIVNGATVETLMERAGIGVAQAVWRLSGGAEILVLCGPGNNGGDGYVAAAELQRLGAAVRVAALGEPKSAAAIAARARWSGPVEAVEAASPAPVLVDALFGTGARPLANDVAEALGRLQHGARLSIAVDLPSNVDTDTGAVFAADLVHPAHVTLALGAVKPSHVLEPAASQCGAVRIIEIGVPVDDRTVCAAERPAFLHPQTGDHKYSRGLVVVVAGAMHGAARLSATAAAHAGAGYVMLLGDDTPGMLPNAIVPRAWSADGLGHALEGKRNAVVVIGPGLGRDDEARGRLAAAIGTGARLIVDGDALHLLDEGCFATFHARDGDAVVLTPHEGEFKALFGAWSGSKIEAARRAAARAGATVVFKGPDTVVATRSGEVIVVRTGSCWLSTAGTGDVLTGAIAAAIVNGAVGDAAAAGTWMHGAAARALGGAFLADDLAGALTAVRAGLQA